jgi:hypothetical protein
VPTFRKPRKVGQPHSSVWLRRASPRASRLDNFPHPDTVTTLYRAPWHSLIKVGEVDSMQSRNKAALWAAAALIVIALFVVSALAKAHGVHRTLYDRAATGAQSGSRPISGVAKPSAAVGVVGPSTKTVGKSKKARRTVERPAERAVQKESAE